MSTSSNLYALLIGINDYEDESVRKLRFAVADVLAFREWLGERTRLAAENCLVLSHPAAGPGPVPRRSDLLDALDRFSRAPMGPEDTFVFYFAGHGLAVGEEGYLLAVDSRKGREKLVKETAVSLHTLRDFLRDLKAGQQLLILDACQENVTAGRGAGATRLDAAMARGIAVLASEGPQSLGSHPFPSRTILSACWIGQVAHEYPAGGHGWFSYNLLHCLGEYPADELDVSCLKDHVADRMKRAAWRVLREASEQEPYLVVEGRPVRLRLDRRFADEDGAAQVSALDRLYDLQFREVCDSLVQLESLQAQELKNAVDELRRLQRGKKQEDD